MTKYRLLTKEELEELEPEFIQYLSANGIDAEKWTSIMAKDKVEMETHLEAFSDLVIQKSLEKISYLEYRTPDDLKVFHFDKEEAFFIGLKSDSVNLEELDLQNKAQLKKIDLFKANKKYSESREEEVFDLLNKGCVISEGALYYQLRKLIPS
jgi:hypothetical protein